MNLFLGNGAVLSSAASAGTAVTAQSVAVCPRCDTFLDEGLVSGEGAFHCPHCKGWWTPEGVLTRLHGAHPDERAPVPFDEASLYARADAAYAKQERPPSAHARARPGSAIGLIYWLTICGIVPLVIALLTWESVRRATATGYWSGTLHEGALLWALGALGGVALFLYGLRLNHRQHLN